MPDLRGLRSGVGLRWAGRALQFQPGGAEEGLWDSGLRVPVPDLAAGKEGDSYDFDFDLGINGSQDLRFLPMGQQTTVALQLPLAVAQLLGGPSCRNPPK